MSRFRIGRVIAVLALVIGASTWAIGCKQGEGERCQIDADCADGLLCNQATQQCSQTSGGGIDATVPDGPPVDAAIDVIDAIDAPTDVPLDTTVN